MPFDLDLLNNSVDIIAFLKELQNGVPLVRILSIAN